MNSAAPKTYISKRMMDQYRERRSAKQSAASQQQQQPQPLVAKKFAEDEEEKKEVQPQSVEKEVTFGAAASVPNEQEVVPVQEEKGFFSKLASKLTFGSSKPKKMQRRASIEAMDRNLSCEEMDSDDLGGDLNLSDCEDGADERNFRREYKSSKRSAIDKPVNKYALEFDTNVFEVTLDCLANKGQMATGDAEFCTQCQAVFNQKSTITEKDGNQTWKCEFCCHENEVMIGEEEIPTTDSVTYLLEAPAQVQDAAVGGKAAQDISVVFCVDISGSMCVTQAVSGKHKIKGDSTAKLAAAFQQFGDGSDQFINQAEKGMTYVSRIQCVKAAIDSQIGNMANGACDRKLGVVTFNNEVQIIGDGSLDPVTVTGDHLNNFEYLENNGKTQAAQRLTKPVKETQDILKAKLEAIEETGPTALGPGILTSVAMAAQGAAGSTVVICTDGLANIGLGAWDECHTEADTQAAQTFYEKVATIASAAGVTINIVSIEGDECNLDALSSLAEATGGKVERVNPTTLTQDFANMLSVPVVATNVDAKVKLHKGLQFRNELATDLSNDKSLLARRFGNTTAETVFTFEYGMKPISQLLEMEDIDMSSISHFPFQTQIQYTALDGSKCLRVITKTMEVSGEREELNTNCNAALLNKNCVQKGTQMARAGNIREAQAIMKGFKRQAKKQLAPQVNAQMMEDFSEQVGDVYGALGNACDSEGEEEVEQVMMSRGGMAQSMAMAQAPSMNRRGGAMMMQQEEMQVESMSMSKASAPKMKKSRATTNVGGKKRLNDEVSTKLYQLSKK